MTYVDFVASRFKAGQAILDDLNSFHSAAALSRLHCVVGIVTELAELSVATSEENSIEELGDTHFYLTALKSYVGPVPENLTPVGDMAPLQVAGLLLDLCKKEVMYKKELTSEQIILFHQYMLELEHYLDDILTSVLELPLSSLEATNMEKLTKRYPVGYSNEAAQARADKKEGE